MTMRFHDYRLENVYLRATEAQRREAMALWQAEGVVPDAAERERRSDEVVLMARTPLGELAGLSSVAIVDAADGRRFYHYRMFIKPSARIPYLMCAVTRRSRDLLQAFSHPSGPLAGLIVVAENPKLMRPGTRRELQRIGFAPWGLAPAGEAVWGIEFGNPITHSN
ncbi:MAG: hypothetical protein Q8Q50_00355 [Methylobacter sp.]|jgi:hypothetical protein|nr:hypothetical protein [Methylobacter sp.]